MSNYIRRRTGGATYFFTIRLARRNDDLLTREIDQLRSAMRATLHRHPFRIDAIAVLPNVIHTLWTLPAGDNAYANRIGMLKTRFSRAMPMPAHRSLTQIKRAEKGIWQRRYWEHEVRDHADLTRHRDMIYLSPVHAGLCATPQAWPHTSLHRDLAQGRQLPDPVGHGRAARPHLTTSQTGNPQTARPQTSSPQTGRTLTGHEAGIDRAH